MILLVSTSDLIQVVTGGTQAISVHASYVDSSNQSTTPGRLNTAIASAATTTVVASPGASTQRNVKYLSIRNKDASASDAVTVQHTDGTTTIDLIKVTLQAGYSLTYNDLDGWVMLDASGGRVETPLVGRFLGTTVILNGTTTFTTGAQTNTLKIRMLAGGGQGGGAPAVAGECGSGGGAGSYAEWTVAVTPNTAYTVAVGAGGTTGGTGAAGQNGGNTTFAVGGTTVTCNGGTGGAAGNSLSVPVLGGAGGAISTNGSLNAGGEPGNPNVCTGTAANNASGAGACATPFGAGGAALLEASNATGNAAVGFGGGGGGASTTGTAKAGGAGSNGVIIVDEYS